MKTVIQSLALLLCMGPAYGEIYKWIDETGRVHFSDKKPDWIQAQEVNLKINTYEHSSVSSSIYDVGQHVVMYSTEWCTYCKKAKAYFASHKIPYTEYDIEKDRAAKIRHEQLGGGGVPVILYGKQRMNGFSAGHFEQMYR